MNKKIIMVVVAVVIAGGSFYAGIKYDQSHARGGSAFRGQFGATSTGRGGANFRTGSGVVAGEILSKDATSVTVKLRDGGSKIVLLSDSTQIMKTAAGSSADLVVGEQIIANGSANTDGSVVAQSIQIRPAGTTASSTTIRQ